MSQTDKMQDLCDKISSDKAIIRFLEDDGISHKKAGKIIFEAREWKNNSNSEYYLSAYSPCNVAPLGATVWSIVKMTAKRAGT